MSRRILVVADEKFIGRLIEVLLTRAGYDVVTALDCPFDCHEPLRRAEAAKPDLMVLDLNVPYVNDFALLRNLKAHPATAEIPVILVTAWVRNEHVFRGWQLGVDFYVPLPLNQAELLSCVEHLFDRQSGAEENGLEFEDDGDRNFHLLAHVVMRQAITRGATEIHVEPQADRVGVRFRIDGEWHEVLSLPGHLKRKLVARYKSLAGMNVEDQSVAQEGRFAISEEEDQEFDCRVSSEPVPNGERVVLGISAR